MSATAVSEKEMRFGFGKNWDNFIKHHFSEERVSIAQKHLLDFLQLNDLSGKYFLDIGCGSGIHSLAAFRSGAARILSFDYDQNSVSTTMRLKQWAGSPAHWEVRQGSILDDDLVSALPRADIVYSWGVLHHTGEMWHAMNNAVKLMKPDDSSRLYIALYDHDIQVNPTAEYWLEVKQRYNREGWRTRRQLEWWYIWTFVLHKQWKALPGLVKRITTHKQSRGMAFYNDIVDWLGGWPMEFAKRADVKDWAKRAGLDMLTMKTGEANTEYLFKWK